MWQAFKRWWLERWRAGARAARPGLGESTTKLQRRPPVVHQMALGAKFWIVKADLPAGKLALTGWRTDAWRFRVGDYLVLELGSGRTTRYVIDKTWFDGACGWYAMECTFAPRGDVVTLYEAREYEQ